MSLQRLDNILIVVNDLALVKDFFLALGMEVEGETSVEGPWVDRIIGLENTRSDIVVLRTPDGHSRIELDKFHAPEAVRFGPLDTPVNTLGIRRIMFAVQNLNDMVSRLAALGAVLLGEIVQFENSYRLCYLRGPEGIIVALAEELH